MESLLTVFARLRFSIACALLFLLLIAPDACATVSAPSLAAAQATCSNNNANPSQSGSAPSSPGHWTNWKRYGTGWDFVYSDDNSKIKAFYFSYSAQGFPTWLTTPTTVLSSDADGAYFTASLQRYTQDAAGRIASSSVGSVGIRFLPNDPTKLAISWEWDALNGVLGGGSHPQYECLGDLARTPPNCYLAPNCAQPQSPSSPRTASAQITGAGVNPLWSGYWNLAGPSDTERVPGIVVNIMQVSQGDTPGYVGEFDLITTFDGAGNPVWYQSQSDNAPYLPSLLATVPTGYRQSNPASYPNGIPDRDCSNDTCISKQIIGNLIRTFAAGVVNGQVLDGQQGAVHWEKALAAVTNQFSSTSPAQAVVATFPPVASDVTILKTTKSLGILVDEYACYAGDASHQCTVDVSWNAPSASYTPYRHNVLTGTYTSLVRSGVGNTNGILPDLLTIGDRVDYELWLNGPPPGGTMIAKTAEVRAYGAANANGTPYVQDAPIASLSSELPAHDASVGAMAGSAGVDGGAATYSIPLTVPPGRNGAQPEISLNYNSRSGNGIAGLGWSLSGTSSIHRCPQTVAQDGRSRPVQLDGMDRLCLDGQRLVPTNSTATYGASGTIYDTEVRSFSQVTQTGSLTGTGSSFTVSTKDGRTMTYGAAAPNASCGANNAVQVVPYFSGGTQVPLSWLLTRTQDAQGNTIDYCYAAGSSTSDPGEVVLAAIYYTGTAAASGNRSVTFTYDLRGTDAASANDWTTSYIAGGMTRQGKRLKQIDTYAPGNEHVRSYSLCYNPDRNQCATPVVDIRTGRSLLYSVQECGYVGATACHDRTVFTWSDHAAEFIFKSANSQFPGLPAPKASAALGLPSRSVQVLGDFDGDGTPDVLITQTNQSDGLLHLYLVKTNADRGTNGYVDLSAANALFAPGYLADFGGDGLSEAIGLPTGSGNLSLYVWNLSVYPRGSAISQGLSASSAFLSVPTNVPYGPGAQVIAVGDFNGDGYPDILMTVPAGLSGFGSCAPPAGSVSLCLFANRTKKPVASQTSYSFSGNLVYQWTTGSTTSLTLNTVQSTDINGDGAPDLFMGRANSGGVPVQVLVSTVGIVPGACGSTQSNFFKLCTLPQLGIPQDSSVVGEAYSQGSVQFWFDVNGDGLADLVYGSVSGCSDGGASTAKAVNVILRNWCIKINTGNGFAPVIPVNGGYQALGPFDDGHLAYGPYLKVMDVDNDGRPDIVYPSAIAARVCQFVQVSVMDGTSCKNVAIAGGTGGTTPDGGSSTPQAGAFCQYWACSEDPSGTFALPISGSPSDSFPIVGLHKFTSQGQRVDTFDPSSYVMSGLRFVQTGPSSFTTVTVPLSATSNGAAHTVVSSLTASPVLTALPQSVYGDGLQDLTALVQGCDPNVHKSFNAVLPACYIDATSSPQALPDGTAVAHVSNAASVTDLTYDIAYINENIGAGTLANDTSAPLLPELMSSAQNALGDLAEWDYAPLSSKAGRGGTLPSLYSLADGSYVADSEYFYLQSSMPVVTSMLQHNGAMLANGAVNFDGFRSAAYSYSGAIYDHLGRGFQGFRKITIDPFTNEKDANGYTRGLRTATTYAQKFPLTGKVVQQDIGVVSSSTSMNIISTTTSAYGCAIGFNTVPLRTQYCPGDPTSPAPVSPAANTLYFPFPDTSVNYAYDLKQAQAGVSSQLAQTVTYFAPSASVNRASLSGQSGWDQYGNLKNKIVSKVDSDANALLLTQQTTTTNTFDTSQVNGNGFGWSGKLMSSAVQQSVGYAPGHALPVGVSPPNQNIFTTYNWNCDRTLNWKATQDSNIGTRVTAPTGCNASVAASTPPASADVMTTIAYTYSASSYGLPLTSTANASIPSNAPAGVTFTARTTTFGYSPDGYFVQRVSNPLSQSTTTTIRPEDGQVASTTDPNALSVVTQYDPLGNPTRISYKNANGTDREPPTSMAWTRCPSPTCISVKESTAAFSASYLITAVKDGAPTQIVAYDALGRAIDKVTRGFVPGVNISSGAPWIHESTTYDTMGTVASTSAPYFQDVAAYLTTYQYDALNRVVSKVVPSSDLNPVQGNVKTTYAYSGDTTTISVAALGTNACLTTPSLCFTLKRIGSVNGKYLQTSETDPNSATNNAAVNTNPNWPNIVTNYWYDGAGNTVAIQDGLGRVTSATYNSFGHRTQSIDPNQGTWSFVYDGLGELIQQTDARGAVTKVTSRDALGRVLVQTAAAPATVPTGMAAEATQDTWTYDTALGSDGGVVGAPTNVVRMRGATLNTLYTAAFAERYTYDATTKRPIKRTVQQESENGTPLVTAYQYDGYYGRLKAITYPGSSGSGSTYTYGVSVGRQYNVYGQLAGFVDQNTLSPIWTELAADAYGHPTREVFGNTVQGTHAYTRSTGQALTLSWTKAGTLVDSISYTYDSLGNLSQQSRAGAAETYAYDSLQRLTGATRTPTDTGCAAIAYQYDAVGDLMTKSDYSRNTYGAYRYGSTRPNAVASVTLADNTTASFTYDGNGNAIGGAITETYDANNQARTVARSGYTDSFFYAPSGNRYLESTRFGLNTTGNMVYGADGFERSLSNGYYTFRHEIGPAVLTTSSASTPATTTYLLRDRLGSVLAEVDMNGNVVADPGASNGKAQRTFDAFGKTRNYDYSDKLNGTLGLAPTTRRGFTGQEHLDEVRVIHMNGRIYDYSLGRFLGVDPIISNPLSSQSLNPYSYIGNNPLSGIDPTGYACQSDGERQSSCDTNKNGVTDKDGGVAQRDRIDGFRVVGGNGASKQSANSAALLKGEAVGTTSDRGSQNNGNPASGANYNGNDCQVPLRCHGEDGARSPTGEAGQGLGYYLGQQLGDAGSVRDWYTDTVSKLDASDSAGRKTAKEVARGKTPGLILSFIESLRASTDAVPGTGGTANASNPGANLLGKTFKYGGRSLVVVSASLGVYDVATSNDRPRALARQGGILAGAAAGGTFGAWGGTFVLPGWGTAIGGTVGSIGGAIVGEETVNRVYNYFSGEK